MIELMKKTSVTIKISALRAKLVRLYAKEHGITMSEFLSSALELPAFEDVLEEMSDRITIEERKGESGSGLTLKQIKAKHLGDSAVKEKSEFEKQMIKDYKSVKHTKEDRDFLNAPSLYVKAPTRRKKTATSKRNRK